MVGDVTQTWHDFAADLRVDILPIYFEHEQSFVYPSIHGRMHACRTILFGEFMCRYYWRNTTSCPPVADVRYAIAFHDAGREGNGPDLWEYASAALCSSYLTANSRPVSRNPADMAALITAKANPLVLEERIVHDADVLDIMRPCCGHGGKEGFWDKALLFLGEHDDAAAMHVATRGRLVDEAWEFICASEIRKDALRGSLDYMANMLDILAENRQRCQMFADSLLSSWAPNRSPQPTPSSVRSAPASRRG